MYYLLVAGVILTFAVSAAIPSVSTIRGDSENIENVTRTTISPLVSETPLVEYVLNTNTARGGTTHANSDSFVSSETRSTHPTNTPETERPQQKQACQHSSSTCNLHASQEKDFEDILRKLAEYVRVGVRKITFRVNVLNEPDPRPLYVNTTNYYQPDTASWLRDDTSVLVLPNKVEETSMKTVVYTFRSLEIDLMSKPAGCITALSGDCKMDTMLRFLRVNVTGQVVHEDNSNTRLCYRAVDFDDNEESTGYVKYHCCGADADKRNSDFIGRCQRVYISNTFFKSTQFIVMLLVLILVLFCLPFVVLKLIPANWELPKVYQLEDTEANQRLVVIEEWDMLHYDKSIPIGPLQWIYRLCCLCKVYNPDVNRKSDRFCFTKRRCGSLGSCTFINVYECLRNFTLMLVICPLAYYIALDAMTWIDTHQDELDTTYLTYNTQVTKLVHEDQSNISYVKKIFTSKIYVGFGFFFLLVFCMLSMVLLFYDRGELTRLIIKQASQQPEPAGSDGSKIYKFFFRALYDDVCGDLRSAFRVDSTFPANLVKYWPEDGQTSLKSVLLCPIYLVLKIFKLILKLLLKIPLLSFMVRTVSVLQASNRIYNGKEIGEHFSCRVMLHLLYCYCFMYLLFLITVFAYFIVIAGVNILSGIAVDLKTTLPYVTCAVAIVMYWYGAVNDINEHYITVKKLMFEICRLPDYQKRHALCKHVFIKEIGPLKQLTADKLVYSDVLVFESSDGKTESIHRSLFHSICDEVSPISDRYFHKFKIFLLKAFFIAVCFEIIITFNSDPSFSLIATAAVAILPKVINLSQKSPKSRQIHDDILRNDVAEAIWNYEGVLFTPYFVPVHYNSNKRNDDTCITEVPPGDDFETANEEIVSHIENNDRHLEAITIRAVKHPTNTDQETAV